MHSTVGRVRVPEAHAEGGRSDLPEHREMEVPHQGLEQGVYNEI